MVLATNKKAFHDYGILETFEVGIVLSGPEVKSAKGGQIDLRGSHATIDKNQQVWLINAHIPPYPPAAGVQKEYNPTQTRKLLLRKKEIVSLIGKLHTKGLTLLPLKVYTKRRFIKIELGLARGKKKYDKREAIKKREIEKRIRKTLRI